MREFFIIKEEEEAPEAAPPVEPEVNDELPTSSEDSLDNKVDSFLIKFEKESMKNVGESRLKEAFQYIFEADEEETETLEPASTEAPAPNLNVDAFAKDVARLIDNHESLIDIPLAIYNRALSFVGKNYSKEVVDNLKDVLEKQHGLQFGPDKLQDIVPPPAKGAEGASVTG